MARWTVFILSSDTLVDVVRFGVKCLLSEKWHSFLTFLAFSEMSFPVCAVLIVILLKHVKTYLSHARFFNGEQPHKEAVDCGIEPISKLIKNELHRYVPQNWHFGEKLLQWFYIRFSKLQLFNLLLNVQRNPENPMPNNKDLSLRLQMISCNMCCVYSLYSDIK